MIFRSADQRRGPMPLFRLDASIQAERSVSRRLADAAEEAWRERHSDATVIRRDLAQSPVPPGAWQAMIAARFAAGDEPGDEPGDDQGQALRLSAELAGELVAADAYLLALPLYNWGVSQHVKAWIDMIMADPRIAMSGERLLAGLAHRHPRRRLRRGHAPARLGSRDPVLPKDLRRRARARPARQRGRADPGRGDPGHGAAARA